MLAKKLDIEKKGERCTTKISDFFVLTKPVVTFRAKMQQVVTVIIVQVILVVKP